MSEEKSSGIQREFEEDLRKEIASMLSIFRFNIEISKMIMGRSGIRYEIDVIAEKRDASPNRLLIKCKSLTDETFLRLDEVLCFWAQIIDADADCGIIVTTCKVSESAAKFAEHHRILIITGRRPNELRYKILRSEILGLNLISGRTPGSY